MKRLYCIFLLYMICFSAGAQVTNSTAVPLPAATYTAATVNSPDQANGSFRGVHVIINVTTVNSGNYTAHIQAKDPVSGLYYDVLVGSAISSAGVTVLKVYPGIAASANAAASDILPSVWRVQMIGASTPSAVFSVSANLEQ